MPGCINPDLIETHISWVLLCDELVFKIKKPVHYSFLDFSTREKREYYCNRELELNRRLAPEIYLEVVPVGRRENGHWSVKSNVHEILDFAVCMKKINPDSRMDLLLSKDLVGRRQMETLAKSLASFHKRSDIVAGDYGLQEKFADLAQEKDFLAEVLGTWSVDCIERALEKSNNYLNHINDHLELRRKKGMFRDVHGDLHARNIFLKKDPVIFDCIEFNDDYRRIDLLNEVAFLCMDLDSFQRQDLSKWFIRAYNEFFPIMNGKRDMNLFLFYKAFRANVRAKVNSLRAKSEDGRKQALKECGRYLRLMDSYLAALK